LSEFSSAPACGPTALLSPTRIRTTALGSWRLDEPWRRAVDLYRTFHHMDRVAERDILPLPREWIHGYEARGVDMTSIHRDAVYWWDREVLRWLEEHGPLGHRLGGPRGQDWREAIVEEPEGSEKSL